jgi:serine phosphatase RsbU (regulator of sigma subunit)
LNDIHPLLLRLLRRCGLDPGEVTADPRWAELAKRVSRTFTENDEDRYLRERSLDISSREMQDLNVALAEERKRLQSELLVAQSLQTSILPRDLVTPSFEVAARMVPATEVGGDYYDVIPSDGACWIGMGDVAGHGLRAAVIMTMVQSMTAALVRHVPGIAPREVMTTLNRGVRENVFTRMHFDNHVTMTLFRCADDGKVTYAGAHEPILVVRADTGEAEEFDTPGTWLGPLDDIADATTDSELILRPGDLLVAHTDGVTEARDASRKQFGFERMKERVLELRGEPVGAICDAVIADVRAWQATADDDVTVLAYRQRPT